jgi:tetrahydromethanopterin S-methyltransferase subunit G
MHNDDDIEKLKERVAHLEEKVNFLMLQIAAMLYEDNHG